MHASQHAAVRGVDVDGEFQLPEDVLEATGLEAAVGPDRVAVHRIRDEQDRAAGGPHRIDQCRQVLLDPFGAVAVDEGHPAGFVVGMQPIQQLLDEGREVGRIDRRADLHRQRIADAAEELDVGVVDRRGASRSRGSGSRGCTSRDDGGPAG